jgi:hypothetical protein
MNKKNIVQTIEVIFLALFISLGISYVHATSIVHVTPVPPAGNVDGPLNVGTADQTKLGGLIVGANATAGDVFASLDPANFYNSINLQGAAGNQGSSTLTIDSPDTGMGSGNGAPYIDFSRGTPGVSNGWLVGENQWSNNAFTIQDDTNPWTEYFAVSPSGNATLGAVGTNTASVYGSLDMLGHDSATPGAPAGQNWYVTGGTNGADGQSDDFSISNGPSNPVIDLDGSSSQITLENDTQVNGTVTTTSLAGNTQTPVVCANSSGTLVLCAMPSCGSDSSLDDVSSATTAIPTSSHLCTNGIATGLSEMGGNGNPWSWLCTSGGRSVVCSTVVYCPHSSVTLNSGNPTFNLPAACSSDSVTIQVMGGGGGGGGGGGKGTSGNNGTSGSSSTLTWAGGSVQVKGGGGGGGGTTTAGGSAGSNPYSSPSAGYSNCSSGTRGGGGGYDISGGTTTQTTGNAFGGSGGQCGISGTGGIGGLGDESGDGATPGSNGGGGGGGGNPSNDIGSAGGGGAAGGIFSGNEVFSGPVTFTFSGGSGGSGGEGGSGGSSGAQDGGNGGNGFATITY